MDCRMDQVTSLSFSPWCSFQPGFLRLGSIIFYKSWVPFDLKYCGTSIGTDNFQKFLSLSLSLHSWNLPLSTSRAWYNGCTEQSRCMTRFVHGQVTVSELSLTLIKIEKASIKGKWQHHFWVFTVPSEGGSKGWRPEWSCHVAKGISVCQGPTAWGQQWLLGTGQGQLIPWDYTEALGCVMMTLGYQHLRSFRTILKPVLPLPQAPRK